tara:strand:+ start:196 stop:507 length:312 start_codon:yes stop_codon:yes gene_type:complete
MNDEYKYMLQSHHFLSFFLRNPPIIEELPFIDVRPSWLVPQKNVYENSYIHTCSICMNDYFKEQIQIQHILNHPHICIFCFPKLLKCPFCRSPLFHNILALIE